MQDRPTRLELITAARELFQHEVLPQIQDPRLKFRVLVALNALGMAERELFAGDTFLDEEWRALTRLFGRDDSVIPARTEEKEKACWAMRTELSARIRAGDPPAETASYLRRSIEQKLAIASPAFTSRTG